MRGLARALRMGTAGRFLGLARRRVQLVDGEVPPHELHVVAVLGRELGQGRQHARAKGAVKIRALDDNHQRRCRAFEESAIRVRPRCSSTFPMATRSLCATLRTERALRSKMDAIMVQLCQEVDTKRGRAGDASMARYRLPCSMGYVLYRSPAVSLMIPLCV